MLGIQTCGINQHIKVNSIPEHHKFTSGQHINIAFFILHHLIRSLMQTLPGKLPKNQTLSLLKPNLWSQWSLPPTSIDRASLWKKSCFLHPKGRMSEVRLQGPWNIFLRVIGRGGGISIPWCPGERTAEEQAVTSEWHACKQSQHRADY